MIAKSSSQPALWTRDYVAIIFSNLFLYLSIHSLIPTIPAYVAFRGGDELFVGLSTAAFNVTALATRPFSGVALDILGRRKVLIAGLFILLISSFGYFFAQTVALILLVRLLHGSGFGAVTTACGTIVSDLVPARRRGEGMGYYGLANSLSMASAPLLGIWITHQMGYDSLFIITTGLVVLCSILLQPLHLPAPETATARTQSFFSMQSLVEPKAFFPASLMLCLSFTFGGIVSFITLFGRDAGIENAGWFFLAHALMVAVTRPIAGVLFDQRGPAWVLLPGAVFSFVGLLLLSYTNNVTELMLAALFYGAGFGAIHPSLHAWTINRVPADRRGAANASFFSSIDLGIGAGALLLGLVAEYTSFALMYRYSAILMIVYLVIYGFHLLGERSPQSRPMS